MTKHHDLHAPYDSRRAAEEQTVLHALAAALALEDVALEYSGDEGEGAISFAPLSFADVNMETMAALQQSLQLLFIRCTDFQPEHWELLCSLRNVYGLVVCLHSAASPAPLASYHIQCLQLSSLRELMFQQCDVSLQPLLQHLSALTQLESLSFHQCSEGLSALSSGFPLLHHLCELQFVGCTLASVPPLRHLLCLQNLYLDHERELKDVLGLRGLTSLTKLAMRGCTPFSEDTLDTLRQLSGLQEIDMSGHEWTPRTGALLGRLQHWSHEQHVKLIV
jgi:hypothetical protein